MKVLLAGGDDFGLEVLEPLRGGELIEVVGLARTAAEAEQMIEALHPDVVLVDPQVIGDTRHLSTSAAIVFVSPSPRTPERKSAPSESGPGALELALVLASAMRDVEDEDEDG